MGFNVAFNSLGHIAKRYKPGRNSIHLTNSSKRSFSCRWTIDSPPQRRTFIKRPRKSTHGDPAETRTCKRMLIFIKFICKLSMYNQFTDPILSVRFLLLNYTG